MGWIEVKPGFLFFLAMLSRFREPEIFWPWLAAAFLHELGHALTALAMGGHVNRLRFGFGDICMELSPLPRRRLVWVTAAGPVVNLVCGAALRQIWPVFAAISLLLGLFNLLPLPVLDGGRLIQLFCEKKRLLFRPGKDRI